MRVGMVGLGVMGAPMAYRLAAAGFEVWGYNRTRAKAAALEREVGLRVLDSPRQAAEQADVVLSMVANDEALREVSLGADGILAGLSRQQIWVDFSTVSPALSVELGERAAERGGRRLEAPVSGAVAAAQAGELVILLSGDPAAIEAVAPILDHLGNIQTIGALGQSLALKLAINLSIPLQVLGFAEGLAIAERASLDRDRVIGLMLDTAIASPMLKYRIPFAQQPPKVPWFTVEMMLKDIDLALGEAVARSIEAPLTALARSLLQRAVQLGFGRQEVGEVVRMVEAGLQGTGDAQVVPQ